MVSYPEVSLDFIPFPNPDVLMKCKDDGSATLVNFDSGHALLLNAVGRFIWETANGDKSVRDLICQVKEDFEGVPESVENDMLEMVRILSQGGFFGKEIKTV